MRTASFILIALSTATLAGVPSAAGAAPTLDPDLQGTWKLVVAMIGENDLLILDLKREGGRLAGRIKSGQQGLEPTEVAEVEQKGDALTLGLKTPVGEGAFAGRMVREGTRTGKILGTFRIQDRLTPARLERTAAQKVGPFGPSPLMVKLGMAARQPDVKVRVGQIKALLANAPDDPVANGGYPFLLRDAAEAGLTEPQVRDLTRAWLAQARPYGAAWTADVSLQALQFLAGKKPYASLSLELATDAEKGLGEGASTEQRAEVARRLADAARAAGKVDLAAEAEVRARQWEGKLDEEYLAKVPPFRPEAFGGRKDAADDRVVMMELFTGAECPPCVAADVAFDALLRAYKPTELVALQYHMHVPGPDPLANANAIARSEYYKVGSTPTALFNGQLPQEEYQGGGFMMHAESKYGQFREVIDGGLSGKKRASIDLDVSRSGDQVRIKASAQADPGAEEAKPRLRLALTEESVRYVGGNKLRFHHHVVRALPGGLDGKALEAGQCQSDLTIDLAEVRKGLEDYLDEFEKSSSFPRPRPPIELKDLAVVAFVQDDSDKAVWQAVVVPVGEAR